MKEQSANIDNKVQGNLNSWTMDSDYEWELLHKWIQRSESADIAAHSELRKVSA